MKRTISNVSVLCAASAASLLAAAGAIAQGTVKTTAEVTLTRLDCGNSAAPSEVARFSDTYAYADLKVQLTFSCYLIKHGDEYLLWDAGNAIGTPTVKTTIVEQLAQLKLKPEQIKYLGISHYHADHTGQAPSFPAATLLIGKGDWDVITDAKPNQSAPAAPFAHWITGGSKVEPQAADKKDVFGDGSVVMLSTPGHTPGHHSLLVKLKDTGNVLVTGDLAHFQENYNGNGVPSFNTNRADTLASLDRFKSIAKNLQAKVVIQHDQRDINKLPAFPVAAK